MNEFKKCNSLPLIPFILLALVELQVTFALCRQCFGNQARLLFIKPILSVDIALN